MPWVEPDRIKVHLSGWKRGGRPRQGPLAIFMFRKSGPRWKKCPADSCQKPVWRKQVNCYSGPKWRTVALRHGQKKNVYKKFFMIWTTDCQSIFSRIIIITETLLYPVVSSLKKIFNTNCFVFLYFWSPNHQRWTTLIVFLLQYHRVYLSVRFCPFLISRKPPSPQ